MKLKEVIQKLNWEVITGQEYLNNEITGAYCSDLLSDVMGNAKEGNIWITIQVHNNIIAVAALKDISAILIVKGLKVSDETLALAKKEGIPICVTHDSAFECAGKLYNLINE